LRFYTPMRVFLDFEASSLADNSYPIEVGWVFEDGREESHLIRPSPLWTDWEPEAEAIHHISREMLERDGEGHRVVAVRMIEALTGHALYVSAPSWDGKWLSVLLRAAHLPRHALRVRDRDEALLEAALEILRPAGRGDLAEGVIRAARKSFLGRPAKHRALDDAHAERDLWLTVSRLAEEAAGRSG
jgi:hypothetical protein